MFAEGLVQKIVLHHYVHTSIPLMNGLTKKLNSI